MTIKLGDITVRQSQQICKKHRENCKGCPFDYGQYCLRISAIDGDMCNKDVEDIYDTEVEIEDEPQEENQDQSGDGD